jgi:hypothetical protein
MREIEYTVVVQVLLNAIERTNVTGSYQARKWLQDYLVFLEVQEHERICTRFETDSDSA